MSDVRPVENLYAALWKSAATQTVAEHLGQPEGSAAVQNHAIVVGAEKYCDALSAGEALPQPEPRGPEGPMQDSDPEVAAYLAQLHHRMMHDQATVNDAQVQADIAQQLKRLKDLYPDEFASLKAYTKLDKPVFYGPRFRNLNIVTAPVQTT